MQHLRGWGGLGLRSAKQAGRQPLWSGDASLWTSPFPFSPYSPLSLPVSLRDGMFTFTSRGVKWKDVVNVTWLNSATIDLCVSRWSVLYLGNTLCIAGGGVGWVWLGVVYMME